MYLVDEMDIVTPYTIKASMYSNDKVTRDEDNSNYMHFLVYLLHLVGFIPFEATWKRILSKCYLGFCIIKHIILFICEGFALHEKSSDFRSFTEVLNVYCINIMGTMKFLTILWNIETIKSLIFTVENHFSIPGQRSVEWKKNELDNSVKRTKKLTQILLGTAFVTWLSVILMPITEMYIIRKFLTNETGRVPVYEIWFPFDHTVTPYYELTYIFQVIDPFVTTSYVIVFDAVFVSLVIHVCGQYRILQNSLIQLREIAQKRLSDGRTEQSAYDELVPNPNVMREMERCLQECIIHHQRILRFAMELENIFNPSMLAQLLISVMLFCMSFVQVIVSPLMSLRMVTVLGILVYAAVELFMFCWFCEQLSSEGVAVQQAAYDSEWYNASLRYRNSVRFLIQRAQRPPVITAGKFFALSLERFKQVVQVSYSYFTVLMRSGEI